MVNDDCIFYGTRFNNGYTVYACEALTHIECEGCCYYKSAKKYEWITYFNPAGNKVEGVRKKGE